MWCLQFAFAQNEILAHGHVTPPLASPVLVHRINSRKPKWIVILPHGIISCCITAKWHDEFAEWRCHVTFLFFSKSWRILNQSDLSDLLSPMCGNFLQLGNKGPLKSVLAESEGKRIQGLKDCSCEPNISFGMRSNVYRSNFMCVCPCASIGFMVKLGCRPCSHSTDVQPFNLSARWNYIYTTPV